MGVDPSMVRDDLAHHIQQTLQDPKMKVVCIKHLKTPHRAIKFVPMNIYEAQAERETNRILVYMKDRGWYCCNYDDPNCDGSPYAPNFAKYFRILGENE
jgi:hypothetical protein